MRSVRPAHSEPWLTAGAVIIMSNGSSRNTTRWRRLQHLSSWHEPLLGRARSCLGTRPVGSTWGGEPVGVGLSGAGVSGMGALRCWWHTRHFWFGFWGLGKEWGRGEVQRGQWRSRGTTVGSLTSSLSGEAFCSAYMPAFSVPPLPGLRKVCAYQCCGGNLMGPGLEL